MGAACEFQKIADSLKYLLSQPLWPPLNDAPVILHASPSAKHAQIEALQAGIAEVDATVAAISSMMQMLSEVRTSLAPRKSRLKTALNPVSGIPDEILVSIFRFAVASEGDDGWYTSLGVSQVCSRWRAVALSCSILWSSLCVPRASQTRHLMPLFAHRSRNARLRMIFRFPHDDFVTVRHLWPLNSVEITPDIGRQISSMTFIHLQIMPAVVMSTSTALAMSLDSVTVFEGLENNVYPLPCLSRAKRLCVRDATLPTTIVLDSLEALDFTSWHNMRFNPSLTYCQMPLLRRLVLRGMGHYFGVGDEGPISLPLLQSLVIEECHPLIISRFGPMEVPVLHSITIENVQPVQDIPQQQDQGQPGGVARTQQSIRSMLRRMSAQLQSLTLGLPDPEAIINSISYDDGPYASQLPSSLKTLELRVLVLAEPKIGQDAQAVARLQKLLEPRIVSRSTMNTPTPVSGAPTSRTQILHSVKLSRRLVGIHGEWYTTHAGHFETVDDIPPKLK